MTTFEMKKFSGNTFSTTLDYKSGAMNVFDRVHGGQYVAILAEEAKVSMAPTTLAQRFG